MSKIEAFFAELMEKTTVIIYTLSIICQEGVSNETGK